jgi:hypothetical protein
MRTYIVAPRNAKRWQGLPFMLSQICLIWLAIHWSRNLPLPGYSVAVIAGVAALMSIQGDMKGWQKAIWMLIIGAFLVVELRAINKDRVDAQKQANLDRATQDHSFAGILAEQNRQFKERKDGFSGTYERVTGVLATTQKVSTLAQDTLSNITGGESFGYAIPGTANGSPIVMILHNDGMQPLTVHIRALYIPGPGCDLWGEITSCMEKQADLFPTPIDMATVAAKSAMRIPPLFNTRMDPDGTAQYRLEIRAQNGIAVEDIWFRPSNSKSGIAYRMDVTRLVSGKPKKGDVEVKGKFYRLLMKKDWTDIAPIPDVPQ